MRYLCLVYYPAARPNDLSDDEHDIEAEAVEYRAELRASGYLIAADSLDDAAGAMTIWVRDGAVAMAEGPCAEANVELRAFYLVSARDLNDAIRLAARVPAARRGRVEIRPISE